ncbi:hypothetical protein [Mucilaginibacter xinganensis]|uniref:Uncharacterized protein n=1 Tax=Mucilaginibacter xinganensis TaxID=1234841 RepID=A0A223NQQ6_9SPHI|nr:hypothetical protein [Mucilaginibacter xinganensis]ASU32203.1 hypothetical protein MuYL_0300 [Mucilaginibacter xinganensis]
MNSIEETLWNYIDGFCTADEYEAVTKLIAADEAYRLKYHELLALNKAFDAIELDEPPMAFTYNVIEAIRTEQAQVPLKAAINKRIIMGIALFFVFTLTGFIIYAITSMDWSAQNIPDIAAKVPAGFKMPELSAHISKPLVEGFMFFDVVLALFLFDTYLRRKNVSKQVN